MNDLLLYIGGAVTIIWGIAHMYPTRKIVQSFEPITPDNRGGRVDFIMYRLCAPIFTLSAALILTGAFA